MADPVYTDTLTILRGHLDEIIIALDTANRYHVADDLTRQYKNVGGTYQPSNLTRRLETALERAQSYLEVEAEPEVEVE